MKFFLTHPGDARPTLIVETCTKIEPAVVERFGRTLSGIRCHNGILIDSEDLLILREVLTPQGELSVTPDMPTLPTVDVIGPSDGICTLNERVERWLESLSANWRGALARQTDATRRLLPDIVPAASGSHVQAVALAA
jgi:hypothetical protein